MMFLDVWFWTCGLLLLLLMLMLLVAIAIVAPVGGRCCAGCAATISFHHLCDQ